MAANLLGKRPKLPKRKSRYRITFDESVDGTLPMRTYRSPKPISKPAAAELIVRTLAAILSVLLILRLIEALALPANLPLANTLNVLTDPLITPFRLLFGSTSVSAFFALAFVMVLAPILIHRFRDSVDTY